MSVLGAEQHIIFSKSMVRMARKEVRRDLASRCSCQRFVASKLIPTHIMYIWVCVIGGGRNHIGPFFVLEIYGCGYVIVLVLRVRWAIVAEEDRAEVKRCLCSVIQPGSVNSSYTSGNSHCRQLKHMPLYVYVRVCWLKNFGVRIADRS